ncbi:Low temperature requirement protein LtrA [Ruminococcaceae bacterium P7]|nr:Low temperature requirement protein LtrA [Ruminococcaceae bacterium P7]
MLREVLKKEEKKVEYLELIYDLIFVYVIGRNNTLLHNVSNGFVEMNMFAAYLLCSLTVIQIWSFSTYYINMHGRNGLREHVFILINMFLLYFLGEGTRADWQQHQLQYVLAWALILINIGTQYILELRNRKNDPMIFRQTRRMLIVLFGEAAIVLCILPVYHATGVNLAPAAILYGIVGTMVHGKNAKVRLVDFTHLSERIMLYVVFTFGEMIIALSGYFEGELTVNSVYFALMSFLIVVGLFLSYGTVYDHLIDREMSTPGLIYMLLHIILIFALSLITASLEFMRNDEINLLPKMILLILSVLMFYLPLFFTLRYGKSRCRPIARFILLMTGIAVSFVLLMLLFREYMHINIALTVLYVFGVFFILYRFGKAKETPQEKIENSNE